MQRQHKFAKMAALVISCSLLFLTLTLASAQNAQTTNTAAVPHLIRFGGVARDLGSKPIAGTVGITFLLYKDQEGGAPLWMETQNVQADAKGNYTVQLGATQPDGLPTDIFASAEARWLGVQISGQAEQPRVLLVAVPYALKAADAETIGGLPVSAFVRANPETSSMNSSAGASGVEAASPGTTSFPEGAKQPIQQANQAVKTPGGVAGYLPVFTSANLIADSNVYQNASGVNVNGPLNLFDTKNGNGNVNAAGQVTATNFVANLSCCAGEAFSGTVAAGDAVYGQSNSGTGVYGYAATGTAGVYGLLSSGSSVYSYGVYGENDSASGGKGVYGTVPYGTEGFGVQGYATGSNAIGVAGSTNTFGTISHQELGAGPIGIIGDSSTGIGIMAASDNGFPLVVENLGTKDALFVYAQGGGYPIVAQGNNGYLVLDEFGNLSVTGAIVGAVKSFKIDDPLDPANKFLYHASIESSEMKNLYDGVAMLDGTGSATVTLPDWFETVNGDFRYQLTAIGAAAPNLHIAQEVANGQFTIAGGQAGMKVSWQVTGVRHDAYAKAHPIQVVAEKSESERGYYIHPEFYGEPAEKSLAAAHRAQALPHTNEKQSQ